MSARRLAGFIGRGAAALAMFSVGWSYVLITDDSGTYVNTWMQSTIPMQIKLPAAPTLSDGTSQSGSVLAAMQTWNAHLGVVQFSGQQLSPGAYNVGNGTSEIVMDSTVDGEAFGDNVLAVAVSLTDGNERVESDIIFNAAIPEGWDSYGGNLRTAMDIRRVAIHELGHVLGLNHPDQHGQSVPAIMNSTAGDIDALQADDVAGAQSLYGAPGVTPSNDNFASAISLNSNVSFSTTGSNVAATKETGEPNHAGTVGGRSVWWKWTAPFTGTVTLSTMDSNFDTALAVYTGSSLGSLTAVASNDDVDPGVIRTSVITFNPANGTTYYVAVEGWDGYFGAIALHFNFDSILAAPHITEHPQDQSTWVGGSVQFVAHSTGTPPLTYRWQRLPAGGSTWGDLIDGGSYFGTTTSSLTVITTQAMNGDQYRCAVTNGAGGAISNPALLTVDPAPAKPVITAHPVSKVLMRGGTITFAVSATGSEPMTYQWQKNGIPLADDSRITGATTQSLTITDAQPEDVARYMVVVSNAYDTAFSDIANLALPGVVSASAGFKCGFVVMPGGEIWAIGRNEYGKLGDGTTTSRTGLVYATNNVIQVATGDNHTLVLKWDGILWGVGGNFAGQLGDGTKTNRLEWKQMASGVVAAYAGGANSLYLTEDGSLWITGSNYRGQIGDGTTTDAVSPVRLAESVISASAGGGHVCYIKANGELWAVGDNQSGQLGDSTAMSRTSPVKVTTNVSAVAAGGSHTMILKNNGTLWTVGANSFGQLGDDTTTMRSIPVQVASNVTAISAGDQHSAFIKADGSLWGMGSNAFQIFGSGGDRTSPVQIATNVMSVSAGSSNIIYIRTDGSVTILGEIIDGAVPTLPSATGGVTKPASPTGLTMTPDGAGTTARLNWIPVINASWYEVWRHTSNEPALAMRIADRVYFPLYFDDTAVSDQTYYYWIKAVNPAGTSAINGQATDGTLEPRPAGRGADFNGDGQDDILWSHSGNGERAMWMMEGTSVASGAVIGTVAVEWVMSASGDYNGDGNADIFWTNTTTGDRAIWLMNGAQMVTNAYLSVVPVEWAVSGTGDFNDDGKDDVLWTNTATGDRAMWLMDGSNVLGGGYLTNVPLTWQVRGTGDHNGDGKADILWSNTDSGERAMWLMNGLELASGAVIGTVPVEWSISAAGDYNGDGRADIFWTNTVTGDRAMWLMDGTTMSQNAYLSHVPVEWTISASGDYNGDDKADVLWTNTTTGDRAMWFMSGGSVLGGGYLTNVPLEWNVAH